MNELTICVKTADVKMIEKYLVYDGITLSYEDVKLKKMIQDCLNKFKSACDINEIEEPEVIIKATMIWQ
jgi:hypothetical protein